MTRTLPAGVVFGAVSDDEYLRRQVRSYASWRWIDAHVPADAIVLSFSGGDQFYARHPRLWSDAEAARAVTWWARSPAAAVAALEDRGIRWVLVPQPRIITGRERTLPLLEAIRRHALTPVYEDGWHAVYRADADALAGAATTVQR